MPTPGPLELVIILVIALLILGPGKLPDVGSALGKSIREFRKASSDVQDAVKVDTIAAAADPAPTTAPAVAPPNAAPPERAGGPRHAVGRDAPPASRRPARTRPRADTPAMADADALRDAGVPGARRHPNRLPPPATAPDDGR